MVFTNNRKYIKLVILANIFAFLLCATCFAEMESKEPQEESNINLLSDEEKEQSEPIAFSQREIDMQLRQSLAIAIDSICTKESHLIPYNDCLYVLYCDKFGEYCEEAKEVTSVYKTVSTEQFVDEVAQAIDFDGTTYGMDDSTQFDGEYSATGIIRDLLIGDEITTAKWIRAQFDEEFRAANPETKEVPILAIIVTSIDVYAAASVVGLAYKGVLIAGKKLAPNVTRKLYAETGVKTVEEYMEKLLTGELSQDTAIRGLKTIVTEKNAKEHLKYGLDRLNVSEREEVIEKLEEITTKIYGKSERFAEDAEIIGEIAKQKPEGYLNMVVESGKDLSTSMNYQTAYKEALQAINDVSKAFYADAKTLRNIIIDGIARVTSGIKSNTTLDKENWID